MTEILLDYSITRDQWVKIPLNEWPTIAPCHDPYKSMNQHYTSQQLEINPLRAKFFRGNINIYLHFVSFLHIDMTHVVEILPQIRQEPTYST